MSGFAASWGKRCLVLMLFGACLAGCGGAKGTQSSSRPSSLVTSDATPALHGLKGDGDDDDTPTEVNGNPGIKLDSDQDKDNDYADNAAKGYYDSDDSAVLASGHPPGLAEGHAITAVVEHYFAAAAASNGARACSLITSTFVHVIPEDYGQAPGPAYARGNTCPVVTAKVFAHIHSQLADPVKVVAVRVNGGRAQALLGSKAIPASMIALQREHGAWKIDSLLGLPLP
ncbi:MAG TPA: hypothetical protein VIJ39_12330 [Solirubrobacteraceae bacterium]